MNSEKKPVIPAHVMSRHVGGETVILNLNSGGYFGLDPVGARIWQLLSEDLSLPKIVETLLEEFDVEQGQLEADIKTLISELASRGLLEIEP